MKVGMYGLGLAIIVSSVGATVMASVIAAPEIDGSTLSAGLGLLTGSVLILRARWRSR
jgi:hypothetical protein